MRAQNLPHKCVVQVSCDTNSGDFGHDNYRLADKVIIKRKASTEISYKTIGEIDVVPSNRIVFTFEDITCMPGYTYSYACIPVINGHQGAGSTVTVECSFSSLFIGNLQKQYVGALNPQFEYTRHYSMSYVTPYYSKHPYAIKNGSQNYDTGTAGAVFLQYDQEKCQFLIEGSEDYKREIMDYLSDGVPKILKTWDGFIKYVSIDSQIKENFTGAKGGSSISFNWTEIGQVPSESVVIV